MLREKINYILIFEGNGKGTKVFQNHLDGHSQIVMIPGTISSYFYIFYKKFHNREPHEILNLFNKYFKSLFNLRYNKGSEQFGKIYKSGNKVKEINKKIFNEEFLKLYTDGDKNFFNFINCIHYAYAKALKINLSKIKYFVIHIHNYVFMKEKILFNFPSSTKIIFFSESRIKQNYFQREFKSIIKPNYLNLPSSRNYFQCFFSHYQIFDYLTKPTLDLENIKFKSYLIRFHLFNVNRVKYIKKLLKLFNLKEEKVCFRETLFKKFYFNDYYNDFKTKDYLIKSLKNFKEDKNTIDIATVLLKKFFLKTKQYKKNKFTQVNSLLLFKILIPNKREFFSLYLTFLNLNIFIYFFKNLVLECLNIKKKVLIKYQNNLLINEKFTFNIYINLFSLENLLIKNFKKKIYENNILLTLFIFIYFINNTLLFFLSPIIVFINYLIRVKKNIHFYFNNKKKKYKLKNVIII